RQSNLGRGAPGRPRLLRSAGNDNWCSVRIRRPPLSGRTAHLLIKQRKYKQETGQIHGNMSFFSGAGEEQAGGANASKNPLEGTHTAPLDTLTTSANPAEYHAIMATLGFPAGIRLRS